MRPLGALLASFAGLLATTLVLTGCSAGLDTTDGVGKDLAVVSEAMPEQSTLLIQDASPRVGEEATYSDASDQQQWVVVAICADAEQLKDTTSVEVAIILKDSFTKTIKAELADGNFDDAVACEGRSFR